MTRTRKIHTPRVIALSFGVFVVLVALAAIAQTTGAGRTSQRVSDNTGRVPAARNKVRVGTKPLSEPLFVPAVTYDSAGIAADSVAVSDLNRDGFPDIAVANNCEDGTCAEGSVGVLLGNGDGTFEPAVAYGSGGKSAKSVAIADLNADGKPDLVVANCGLSNRCPPDGGVGTVGVLLANGDGTFQTAVTYLSGGIDPMSVAIADVNNDGKPDLLMGHLLGNGNSTVSVLLGNGDGTFHAAVSYDSGGGGLEAIAVADVNHDGKLDLIAAESVVINGLTGAGAAVLLGNGDGTFQSAVGYFSGACAPMAVALADVNGDGKPDIIIGLFDDNCSGEDQGVVAVLLGNGNGTFQEAIRYHSGGHEAHSVSVGDLNGDGHADIVVANFLDVGLGILLGNGDGSFQPVVTFSSGPNGAISVAVVDVNGDHRPDLIAVNPCCTGFADHGLAGVLLNNTGPHSPTKTELTSSKNPAPPAHVVTYLATVIPQSGQASGTVLFLDGNSAIATVTLAANQAAYSTSYKRPGVHSITATYSGDLHNASSTSPTVTEDIQGISKTVVTSSGSPSVVGQPVTFTATVTSRFSNIPDGEIVAFYDGVVSIGTSATAGGAATFTTSSLAAKTHTIKAKYAGDTLIAPSSGLVQQVVEKYPTTTSLRLSPNPSQFGQAVTFTAHVRSTGPAPTGKVKFLDGATSLGSATVSGGIAKLTKSKLAVGTHAITSQYLGDAYSEKSTSPVVNQVVQ